MRSPQVRLLGRRANIRRLAVKLKTVIKRLRLNGERVSHPTNNYIAANALSSNQPADNLYRDHDNDSATAILSDRGNWCEHSSVGGTWNSGAGVEVRCTIPEVTINWAALAQPLAEAECRARGYLCLRAAITTAKESPRAKSVLPPPPRPHQYRHRRPGSSGSEHPRTGLWTLGMPDHSAQWLAGKRPAVPPLQLGLRKEGAGAAALTGAGITPAPDSFIDLGNSPASGSLFPFSGFTPSATS